MKKYLITLSFLLVIITALFSENFYKNERKVASKIDKTFTTLKLGCYKILDRINQKVMPNTFSIINSKEVSTLSEAALFFRNKEIKNYKVINLKEVLLDSKLASKYDLSSIDPKEFIPLAFEGRHEALSRFLTHTYLKIKETVTDSRVDHDFMAALLSLDVDYLRRKEIIEIIKANSNINKELLYVFEKVYISNFKEIKDENFRAVTDRIANLARIYTSPFPSSYISRITSPYEFYESIARAYDFDNFSSSWAHQISISPFAKRMKITKSEIKAILKQASLLESRSEVENIIQNTLPIFKEKDLKSFSLYDKEPFTNDPLDQCNWGSCWTFSSNTFVELLLTTEGLPAYKIDPDYSYIMAYIYRSYQDVIYNKTTAEGGNLKDYLNYARKNGFLPKGVFKFNEGYKKDLKKKNDIKNSITALKKRYKNERKTVTTEEELDKLNNSYKEKVSSLVFKVTGTPPSQFKFNGKSYTPKSYYDEIGLKNIEFKVKEGLGQFHDVLKMRGKSLKEFTLKLKAIGEYYLKLYGIKKQDNTKLLIEIKEALDQGLPVAISHNTARGEYYDEIGQLHSFRNGLNFTAPSSGLFDIEGGHQQVIVGYSIDKNGSINGLKVQNSWGPEMGQSGVFFMDLNYFNRFTKEVFIPKKKKSKLIPAANDEEY